MSGSGDEKSSRASQKRQQGTDMTNIEDEGLSKALKKMRLDVKMSKSKGLKRTRAPAVLQKPGKNDINDEQKTLVEDINQVLEKDSYITRIIDPEGDVQIQLAGAKLKVSSKILGLASKVWNVMFSSKYAEGTKARSGEQPCCIPHPEDDMQAMTTICLVLHHKGHEIIQRPDTEVLMKLSLLVDKYDCAEAMAYYGPSILGELRGTMEKTQVPNYLLLFPAILFDDNLTFEHVTALMVFFGTSAGQKTNLTTMRYNLPKEVCALLPKGFLGMLYFRIHKSRSD
jgi:hypothetical protein